MSLRFIACVVALSGIISLALPIGIIGNNFSNFSDAGAIAEKVCKTARDRRIVLSSTGGVGVDPKTASYLNSKDGLQGCIDGFNGVPQD